ncbi:hypothetical protein [Sediminicola sp. 1XM1-17]|uniref:hypothetical protein n=1 Tax=Sediminicola sp. 1XM1-17 TaxID=3127702 RepID=UPI003077F13D
MKTYICSNLFEKFIKNPMFLVLLCSVSVAHAQLPSYAYTFESNFEGNSNSHLLLVDQNYLVHTVYSKSPADFKKTVGGYYELKNDHIIVNLEFNSNFSMDSITTISIPYTLKGNQLFLELEGNKNQMNTGPLTSQDLDGKWLMAGRVTEEGENRRDTTRPRKTMKFLHNGYFQWIAFNTETMEFFGTGGGSFTSTDGKYIENIEFFSRDNSRVGASLDFNYNLKNGNWYHMGKSSKGDPLHEIWSSRN